MDNKLASLFAGLILLVCGLEIGYLTGRDIHHSTRTIACTKTTVNNQIYYNDCIKVSK